MGKPILLSLMVLLVAPKINAQQPSADSLFRKFIRISSSYKSIPLQLSITYSSNCNIPWFVLPVNADSLDFFVNDSAAYIKSVAAEQIINDSVILVVSEYQKKMSLVKHTVDVSKMLGEFLTMPNDSLISEMTSNYSIKEKNIGNNLATLEITNKKNVNGTSLPFESNILTFNSVSYQPVTIIVTRRNLLKKDKNDKRTTSAPVVTDSNGDESYVKEYVDTLKFKSISHDTNFVLPVTLTDRIVRDINNKYQPVAPYSSYKLNLL